MAPGIDMLHHFGPLMRSKSQSTHGLLDDNSTRNTFDYTCFRRHFATLFDRIVRLASSSPEEQRTLQKPAAMQQPVDAVQQTQSVDEIGNMERMLNDKTPLSRPGRPNLSSSLEAVEDAEEEEDGEGEEEYDENDLRDTGYRKNYGAPAAGEEQSTSKRSEWVNEDFELPTTEELFSDLGIWW